MRIAAGSARRILVRRCLPVRQNSLPKSRKTSVLSNRRQLVSTTAVSAEQAKATNADANEADLTAIVAEALEWARQREH